MPKAQYPTGVYCWINKINGKKYVGGAYKSFKNRYLTHLDNLRNDRHWNKHFQSSWNKYGEENFRWAVLERLPKDKKIIADRETYWIGRYNATDPKCGYNKCPTGGSPLGIKRSPETRAKISAAGKGRYPSEETRKKMSAWQIGRKRSKETVEKTASKLRGRKEPDHIKIPRIAKLKEVWKNPALREVVSKRFKGKRLSPEHVAKIRGQKRSEECKVRLKIAALKKWSNRRRKRICRTCRKEYTPYRASNGNLSQSRYCPECKPVHHGGRYLTAEKGKETYES